MGEEPLFLAGSCMASVLHLTLRFLKYAKILKINNNLSTFVNMSYNEERVSDAQRDRDHEKTGEISVTNNEGEN